MADEVHPPNDGTAAGEITQQGPPQQQLQQPSPEMLQQLAELLQQRAAGGGGQGRGQAKAHYAFWESQPVPQFADAEDVQVIRVRKSLDEHTCGRSCDLTKLRDPALKCLRRGQSTLQKPLLMFERSPTICQTGEDQATWACDLARHIPLDGPGALAACSQITFFLPAERPRSFEWCTCDLQNDKAVQEVTPCVWMACLDKIVLA
jgi:hypothetical protein